jgi:hypothetical protein
MSSHHYRSTILARAGLLALGFVLSGCGPVAEPPKVDAAAKCYEIRDAYCNRGQTCNEQTGQPDPQFLSSCKSSFSDKTNCSQYTEIIGKPESCLDEVNATPCDLFDPIKGIPLPASCKAKNLFE